MTAPLTVAGIGGAPATPMLDALTAAGATPATPVISDPAAARFAGMLAAIVGTPTNQLKATPDAQSMLEGALASLESALTETGTMPEATGANAIRALIEQVLHTPSPVTAVNNAPVTTPAQPVDVGAAQTALAGTLGVTPTVVPTIVPTELPATPAPVEGETAQSANKRATTQTDSQEDKESSTPSSLEKGTPAPMTAAIDPSMVLRDTALLDPAFKAKLDRVIDRMKNEFGHTVTVVETLRSQGRQDALYAQGRTAPGDVVTWTRNSRHNAGLAADLMVDGSYDNPSGYAHLQQIAAEEGLHTLGARDPGHVELRSPQVTDFAKIASATPKGVTLKPSPDTPAATVTAGTEALARISRVARVSHVATVASVARVAHVARVAVPGSTGPLVAKAAPTTNTTATPATEAPAVKAVTTGTVAANTPTAPVVESATPVRKVAVNTAAAVETTGAPSGKAAAGDAKSSTKDNGGAPNRERATAANANSNAATYSAMDVAPATSTARFAGNAVPVEGSTGPDQSSRVAQIDALHEQSAAQPMSSMTLQVDDGNGGTDRIRVDVRGRSVQSTIDVRDPQRAADVASKTNDLARALESRGLEADTLRVRAVAAERPMTETLRSAIGAAASEPMRGLNAATAADASGSARREREESRDGRQGQAQQESNRQRARQGREEYQP